MANTYIAAFRNNNKKVNRQRTEEQKRIDQENKEFWIATKRYEHDKIIKYINNNFSKLIANHLSFDKILTLRAYGENIGIQLHFSRFINGDDWLSNPRSVKNRISNQFPIFNKLLIWNYGQNATGNQGKMVKIDLVWRNNLDDIQESGMDSAEALFVAVQALLIEVNNKRRQNSNGLKRALGEDFTIFAAKRTFDQEKAYKYLVRNAFCAPKYVLSRDENDDIAAKECLEGLQGAYPKFNITVKRWGGKYQKTPKTLLVTSSGAMDLKTLNKTCRRLMEQRIWWDRFIDNKEKPKFEYKSVKQRVNEYRNIKLNGGRHKGLNIATEQSNRINVSDHDYSHHIKWWSEDYVNDEAEKFYKEIVFKGGIDGSSWIHRRKQNKKKPNYVSFGDLILGKFEEKENEIENKMDTGDDEEEEENKKNENELHLDMDLENKRFQDVQSGLDKKEEDALQTQEIEQIADRNNNNNNNNGNDLMNESNISMMAPGTQTTDDGDADDREQSDTSSFHTMDSNIDDEESLNTGFNINNTPKRRNSRKRKRKEISKSASVSPSNASKRHKVSKNKKNNKSPPKKGGKDKKNNNNKNTIHNYLAKKPGNKDEINQTEHS